VQLEANIQKIVVGVYDAEAEVASVQFELNMNIMELELKSQPCTLPEVREQREATTKEWIAIVDGVVVNFMGLFE